MLEKDIQDDHLNDRERWYIKELHTKSPHGYNLTDGGDGVPGFKHTEVEVARRRAYRARCREEGRPFGMEGQKHSEATRRRMRASQRRRRREHPVTDEFRERMRELKVGRADHLHTKDATRKRNAAVRTALAGVPKSEETRANMRAAWVLRKARVEKPCLVRRRIKTLEENHV